MNNDIKSSNDQYLNDAFSAFSLIFEKGEHKGESYDGIISVICTDPACPCTDILVLVKNDNQKYSFLLDVVKKKVSKQRNQVKEKTSLNFAKSFVSELDNEDWERFYAVFHSFKAKLVREMKNSDGIKIDFSKYESEIENSSITIAFESIFPFTEKLQLDCNKKSYLLIDQYCIKSTCNCRHAFFIIFETENSEIINNEPVSVLQYEYKNGHWTIDDSPEDVDRGQIKQIIGELNHSYPDINKTLRKRHSILRELYKKYRDRNSKHDGTTIMTEKTGRNDPCPCGSGKKYKKCCG